MMTMPNFLTSSFTAKKEKVKSAAIEQGSKSLYIHKDSAVIYNKFDIQSIFAAAAFSGIVSQNTGVMYEPVDTTAVIHSDYDEYIWLNVEPSKSQNGVMKKSAKTKAPHTVHKEVKFCKEGERKNSLYEDCIVLAGRILSNSDKSLGYMLTRFNDNLSEAELIYLYMNYDKAKRCIDAQEFFRPVYFDAGLIEANKQAFYSFIKKVKGGLRNRYRIRSGMIDGKVKKYCLLTLSETDYPWAVRMVRMSHQHYLNVANGPNGYIVDTNISDLRGIKLVEEHTSSGSC